MLPLIPTLALAFVSFLCSTFVILRIVIPILPPHPLSRRVPPSEFGLPNFKTLSPADKSHLWLAACDILALLVFVWQAYSEYDGGPTGSAVASDPLSAARLWFAATLKQTCLLVVASLTLLHVRLGRPVSFGAKHWMLWAPTLLFIVASTVLAGVFASINIKSFFWGLLAYSSSLAVFSTVAFGCLIGTLVMIRHNLTAFDGVQGPWPPAMVSVEKPNRASFATEDIDALRDGSSWLTSRASSRQESISAFSFSTYQPRVPSNASSRVIHPAIASNLSILPKSSFWFDPVTPRSGREPLTPPVLPLPAPYCHTAPFRDAFCDDPDSFRRTDQRPRCGSQASSWLSEHSDQRTLSTWSFPTSRPDFPVLGPSTVDWHTGPLHSSATIVSGSQITAMASTAVLGGYGYAFQAAAAERGIGAVASVPPGDLDVSIYRTIGWLIVIWIPTVLGLLFSIMAPHGAMSSLGSLMIVLSVTLSAPLLALNLLFRSPLPVPAGLFEIYSEPPSVVMRAPSLLSTTPSSLGYKRSGSATAIEGRRSGDVWIANGDAVDGRSKLGRAMGLLAAKPKLAVIPPAQVEAQEAPHTLKCPMQTDDDMSSAHTPQAQTSVEPGMKRVESMASLDFPSVDECAAFASQILAAQRHYSALSKTFALLPTPDRKESSEDSVAEIGVEPETPGSKRLNHLRVCSASSPNDRSGPNSPITPPPSLPLPPTPASIRVFKTACSQTLGSGIRFSQACSQDVPSEMASLSVEFTPPAHQSTPIGSKIKTTCAREGSGHKRHHFSLPSLSLGTDGEHSLSTWCTDLSHGLGPEPSEPSNEGHRNTLLLDDLGLAGLIAARETSVKDHLAIACYHPGLVTPSPSWRSRGHEYGDH